MCLKEFKLSLIVIDFDIYAKQLWDVVTQLKNVPQRRRKSCRILNIAMNESLIYDIIDNAKKNINFHSQKQLLFNASRDKIYLWKYICRKSFKNYFIQEKRCF
jgi:hypothetical protein